MKIKSCFFILVFLSSCATKGEDVSRDLFISPPKSPNIFLEHQEGASAPRAAEITFFIDRRFDECERMSILKAMDKWNKQTRVYLGSKKLLFAFGGGAIGK